MKNAVRFSVSMSPELLRKFDDVIRGRWYTNRSKAIRDLIRDYIVGREWEKSEKEVMGSLTLIYNHHTRGLVSKLISIQHQQHINIISTMHVHLDHHNCMEILAIRGSPNVVNKISNRLISTRGVKHGKLVMTTTGEEVI